MSSLTFDLRPNDGIGPKRSGALCIPAGGFAWRDAKPDAADAAAAVTARLVAASIAPRLLERDTVASDSGYVIEGQVRAIRLSACVPPGGLGRLLNHSTTIKGDGDIAVLWRVYDAKKRELALTQESCAHFSFHQGGSALSDVTLAGIAAAADDLAAHLVRAAGSASVEQTAHCPPPPR